MGQDGKRNEMEAARLGLCAKGVWDTQGRGLSYHLGNLPTLGNLTRKLPRKTVVRTGDTAIFWVELDVPEGPVRWLRNQEEMVAGGRVAITAEGTCHTLTIFQCTLEDMGEVAFVAGGCRTTTQFCVSGKGWKDGLWVALLPHPPSVLRAPLASGSPRVAENCNGGSPTLSSFLEAGLSHCNCVAAGLERGF